jgi:SpoVK/Ycf46/Vps4 family AAA+-type ATPase
VSSLSVLCYWNPLQVSLLMKKPKRVLFDSDFGCGKTLLMKHTASCLVKEIENSIPKYVTTIYDSETENTYNTFQSEMEKNAKNGKKKEVFFVSLTAAKTQEFDETTWTKPAVMDIANRMDFEGTGVKVNDSIYNPDKIAV